MTVAVVTLTGPPGSGKTTAGRLAADQLGLEFVSAGAFFRAEAERRGMALATFSGLAESNPEIDRALDERMVELAGPNRFLEGRITGALLRRAGIAADCLLVTAREPVRIDRIAGRDGVPRDVAAAALKERERSEADRYRRYYGLELDRVPVDLTVDASDLPPDAVADRLASFVRARRTA